MKLILLEVLLVSVCLMFFGCYSTSMPFIKFEEIPAKEHFPNYSIADTLSAKGNEYGDIAYVNALINDQRLNEALYFCNSYLLKNPQGTFATHMRFNRLKIQLLQDFIGRYDITRLPGYNATSPRTNICASSMSNALNAYFKREGIDACASSPDTDFTAVRYPTNEDVRFFISLKNAAKLKLDNFVFDIKDSAITTEKQSMSNFLDDFEREIVPLAEWKYVQNGSWDSATAYCDFMATRYPSYSDYLGNVKNSIATRTILPGKSKAFAGIAAAVIPGTGHLYCNEYSEGLYWFLGIGAQAAAAAFMLYNASYPRDRSEIVFGSLLSITTLITYIANITSAVDKADTYNKGLKKDEIGVYLKNLKELPPGVKKK